MYGDVLSLLAGTACVRTVSDSPAPVPRARRPRGWEGVCGAGRTERGSAATGNMGTGMIVERFASGTTAFAGTSCVTASGFSRVSSQFSANGSALVVIEFDFAAAAGVVLRWMTAD